MAKEIIPIEKALDNWAIVAIDRFQAALTRLHVGHIDGDGELIRSFMHEVQNNGGNAYTVIIRFLNYGRFVDMGVGRGDPLGRTDSRRLEKKWYSSRKTQEITILRFLMAKRYNMFALQQLESELKMIEKDNK